MDNPSACIVLDLSDFDGFDQRIRRLIEGGSLAAIIGRTSVVRDVCLERVAFVVDGDESVARALDADGIIAWSVQHVAGLRARLPATALIGVYCGLSRHDAMVAGEAGADYLLFGHKDEGQRLGLDPALEEMVSWTSDLTMLPSIAIGSLTAADAGRLIAAGADMVMPTHQDVADRLKAASGIACALGQMEVTAGGERD